MEVAAIMEALKENRDSAGADLSVRKLPREALEQAIAQKNDITPLLIAEITPTPGKLAEILENSTYFRHIYAFYLLAQFREPQAYPVMIDFVSTYGEAIMEIMPDVVTGDLGCILASVCGGDLLSIKQLIENIALNDYVREAGLKALITLVVEGEVSRESVLAYIEELWPKVQQEESDDDVLYHSLIMGGLDLCPNDSLTTLFRDAYENNRVDPNWSRIGDLDKAIEMGIEESIARLSSRQYHRFVTDVTESMGWWACFQENNFPKPRRSPSVADMDQSFGFTKPKKNNAKRKKKRQAQKQARKQNRSKKKR